MTTHDGKPFNREMLESLVRRRCFYLPSFEPYGGVKGLYDYGAPLCGIQTNVVNEWRKHFVKREKMFELDCSVLTPYDVLKTSGHVDRFIDWMCKDPKTGELLRADHLVEDVLEARLNGDKEARGEKVETQEEPAKKKKKAKAMNVKLDDELKKEYEEILAKIDGYNGEELGLLITKHRIKNGDNEVLPPVEYNLMFSTTLGASGPAFLRPETAQAQFLNFASLLEQNQNEMPFASASVGKSYRNEISPRSGLLRVREFLMGEIEMYVDPEGGKKHPRFEEIKDVELAMLDRHTQTAGKTDVRKIAIGKAVADGIVDNETLGYFLVRIQQFMAKIGVDQSKLRFRQHMANEMAHYAADCWDAELLTSYGWIECVGCADRSAYDLTVHMKKTGAALLVRETRKQPLHIEEWQATLDRKKAGPKFKKDGKAIEAAVDALTQEMREKLSLDLEREGKITLEVPEISAGSVELEKELIKIEKATRIENTREYIPNVIEPSFGFGRILYSLLEHSFWTRPDDAARSILSFQPSIAPTKVLLVPLSKNTDFDPLVKRLDYKLSDLGIEAKVDASSVSIGKRYSRNDGMGTPLGITVDFQSIKDATFTLRDRDTTKQVRASEAEILQAVLNLVHERETWADVQARLPAFEGQEVD
ncbi:hypothetical protein B0A49_06216 [Cryomyces minteri]|uniref:glycine--tRNA ligase n=1 Tax=Cryomyces minteri TaxID=331657 RepID=A0A4U0WY50_9PEZI|nr:hypothetical protein B0A49_06216 [Cryomyces minteri]